MKHSHVSLLTLPFNPDIYLKKVKNTYEKIDKKKKIIRKYHHPSQVPKGNTNEQFEKSKKDIVTPLKDPKEITKD